MRTRVSVKTWLLEHDGEAIGTTRAINFEVGKLFEANVHNSIKFLRAVGVDKERRVIMVK
jgi:hypothetical protein